MWRLGCEDGLGSDGVAGLDLVAQRRHKRRNRLQAVVLLAGMVAVLALCAWVVAGAAGVGWVAIAAAILLAWRPTVSARWVLRAYGAQPLPPVAAPELHRLVAVLAQRAGLPAVPRLHYVPTRTVNAFAVGRPDESAVAITDGLLRALGGRELVAVLAHELSHIRADDLWVMTLADTVGRLTHALTYAGLLLLILGVPLLAAGTATVLMVASVLVVAPTAVTLLQLALSRSREYDADLEAAALTGDPEGLARALQVLEHAEGRIWERILVPHRRSPDPLLLRTHPPTSERLRRLRELVPAPQRRISAPDLRVLTGRYPTVTRPVRLRSPGVWR